MEVATSPRLGFAPARAGPLINAVVTGAGKRPPPADTRGSSRCIRGGSGESGAERSASPETFANVSGAGVSTQPPLSPTAPPLAGKLRGKVGGRFARPAERGSVGAGGALPGVGVCPRDPRRERARGRSGATPDRVSGASRTPIQRGSKVSLERHPGRRSAPPATPPRDAGGPQGRASPEVLPPSQTES